jgi:two-component system chemotaxis response regulator CheY
MELFLSRDKWLSVVPFYFTATAPAADEFWNRGLSIEATAIMGKSIMSVDDSSTMRRMVSFTLKSAGYDVIEASDGAEALNLLKSRAVDLVISDINMPNLDGIELTRQLRSLPSFIRTPIILLTTESDPGKKAEGRAAGATGWIVKPFNQEQLLAVVAKVVPN